MDYLTVGYVSGIIAAAVTIAQLIVPNALVILLIARLSDNHSGVTWSVVGRALSNSQWPLFLGSDQTASQNVSRWVNFITLVKPLTLFLIAIAAIVTPMGLYESIGISADPEGVPFSYIEDRGPLGLGTPLRTDIGFSRSCDTTGGIPLLCPGSNGFIEYSMDDQWSNATTHGLDYRVPHRLAALYQSGLTSQASTVSSFFDIQARLYNIRINQDRDNSTYLVDGYRSMGSFILDDKMQAVEGLIVDTKKPKIGFRNHTAPVNSPLGAEWDEDLLFLEPETKCVDVNISHQIEVPPQGVYYIPHPNNLVDKGGFVNMDIISPWTARMGDYVWYDGTQEDPALDFRAQATGWIMNAFLAYFFNVTKPREREAYMNSEVGNLFPVNNTLTKDDMNQIMLTTNYHTLVDSILPRYTDYGNGTAYVSDYAYDQYWDNPFNISNGNFTLLPEICEGVGLEFGGRANMTNIQVKCGLVVGTARPTRGEKTLIPRPGSLWEQPIYSCASTTKATIKTVRFRYNSTNNDPELIKRFEVLSIVDKIYNSRDEMPLWGIEDANMSVRHVNPLWGLIDPSLENSVNLSTVRADHLYIPTGKASIDFDTVDSGGTDFIPAVTGPAKAWSRVYESFAFSNGGVDYTGAGGIAVYNKWDSLSQTADGAAQILNLIFTDYAANALVGTRSQLSGSELPPNLQKRGIQPRKRDDNLQPGEVPVHLYHRAIRYRWVYGIPALLSVFVVSLILLGALFALLTGCGSTKRVKHYLWNLSAGRILTTFIHPGSSHMYSDTKDWIKSVGGTNIVILRGVWPQVSSPDVVAGAGIGAGLRTVTTSYQRVARDEPKEGVRDGVTELRHVNGGMKSLGYEANRVASSDYVVPR